MTIKDKNKIGLNTKNKILVLGLVLLILGGLFTPVSGVQAQAPGVSQCYTSSGTAISLEVIGNKDLCRAPNTWREYTPPPESKIQTSPGTCNNPIYTTQKTCEDNEEKWTPTTTTTQETDKTSLYSKLPDCGVTGNASFTGCILTVAYWIFYSLPASILRLTAYLFNTLLAITLSSVLYTSSSFIPEAWRIVRDFSNIFFILILLYIAIKMILGLGGAEIKKMIVNVIMVALLINFSMFMTKVVIDSSNILALIFYNKISVDRTDGKTGTSRPWNPILKESATGVKEKDFAGAIVQSFDPTKFMSEKLFENHRGNEETFLKNIYSIVTLTPTNYGPDVGFILTVIFISGAIFLAAAYAFFIAALAFFGRLIELWLCIIFSPVAFLSLTVPALEKYEYFGWTAWLKRLIDVAFMAPIFMFMMLLISKLVQAPILNNLASENLNSAGLIMLILIPAIINITLLYKATGFAKKGAGTFGEAIIKYGTAAAGATAGLALGAATGGAALLATGTLGRAGSAIANSGRLKDAEAKGGLGGFAAGGLRNLGKFTGSGSFDARKIPGVGNFAKKAGINLEASKAIGLGPQEGGWEKRKKDHVEKRQKIAKELEVGEEEPLKQALNKTEGDLHKLLSENAQVVETLDKTIDKKRQEVADAEKKLNAAKGTSGAGAARADLISKTGELDFAKQNKKDFRSGGDYMVTDPRTGTTSIQTGTRVNIEALEEQKKDQTQAIKIKNVERKVNYAKSITKPKKGRKILGAIATAGIYNSQLQGKADRQAAHAIIMDAKLPDSAAKPH